LQLQYNLDGVSSLLCSTVPGTRIRSKSSHHRQRVTPACQKYV